jgi:putative membrane protein
VLFVAVLAHQGVRDVGAALARPGPACWSSPSSTWPRCSATRSAGARCSRTQCVPPVSLVLFARWIGESVNGLLPVLQVGGNVAKARVLVRRGVPGAVAGATVVVDVTLVVATQVVFTLVGIALLLAHLGFTRLTLLAAAGAAATTALLAVTFVLQRRSPFTLLARLSGRIAGADRQALTAGAAAIDAGVVELYRDRRPILASAAWHLVAWFVGAGEVWLALMFLGHPVPLHTAVLLESLGQAVRTGFFLVPGALGVQEGGFVLLGGALGLAPDTALALSLTRRCARRGARTSGARRVAARGGDGVGARPVRGWRREPPVHARARPQHGRPCGGAHVERPARPGRHPRRGPPAREVRRSHP